MKRKVPVRLKNNFPPPSQRAKKERKMSLLDKLFVSLRVLSKLPEGGRICTTSTGQIKIEDTNSMGGWIATSRRRITGDSREEAVKVLMQIINDVSELSDNIIDSIRNYGENNTAPIGPTPSSANKLLQDSLALTSCSICRVSTSKSSFISSKRWNIRCSVAL
jgi:hypothetical protein